ncbi:MAG: hypothetical protein ABEJ31_05965 [Haloarculaceae archaeon]
MLVSVYEYREDPATDPVESDGAVDPDRNEAEYFGEDDLDLGAEWERFERDGRSLLRRETTYEGVTAVAVPEDDEPTDPDPAEGESTLPGTPLMIREGGDQHYLEHARLVEAQDASP